ncbi:hypothetical protein K1719_004063 [Acacia pycnantha]|nr:hypothetical protein K1719_004063 [Acacia pycnantha]
MTLLVGKLSSWKVSEWKQQLLLEHIGYNIGDCDLIMESMWVEEHWFCMALDPSMMNFYVLDSMRTKVYMSKNESIKKKKSACVNPHATMTKKIRDCFEEIIEFGIETKVVFLESHQTTMTLPFSCGCVTKQLEYKIKLTNIYEDVAKIYDSLDNVHVQAELDRSYFDIQVPVRRPKEPYFDDVDPVLFTTLLICS